MNSIENVLQRRASDSIDPLSAPLPYVWQKEIFDGFWSLLSHLEGQSTANNLLSVI